MADINGMKFALPVMPRNWCATYRVRANPYKRA